jgi:hypothetical protein
LETKSFGKHKKKGSYRVGFFRPARRGLGWWPRLYRQEKQAEAEVPGDWDFLVLRRKQYIREIREMTDREGRKEREEAFVLSLFFRFFRFSTGPPCSSSSFFFVGYFGFTWLFCSTLRCSWSTFFVLPKKQKNKKETRREAWIGS